MTTETEPRTEAGRELAARELRDYDDRPVSIVDAILAIEAEVLEGVAERVRDMKGEGAFRDYDEKVVTTLVRLDRVLALLSDEGSGT